MLAERCAENLKNLNYHRPLIPKKPKDRVCGVLSCRQPQHYLLPDYRLLLQKQPVYKVD